MPFYVAEEDREFENDAEFFEKYTDYLREQTKLAVVIDGVPDEDKTRIKDAIREQVAAEVINLTHEQYRASGVSDEAIRNARKDPTPTLRELPLPEKDQRILEEKVRRLARQMGPSPEMPGPDTPTQVLEPGSLEPIVQLSHTWQAREPIREWWEQGEKHITQPGSAPFREWWEQGEQLVTGPESEPIREWWEQGEQLITGPGSEPIQEPFKDDWWKKGEQLVNQPRTGINNPCVCASTGIPGMWNSIQEALPLPAPPAGQDHIILAVFLYGASGPGMGAGPALKFKVFPKALPRDQMRVGLSTQTGWARQIVSWNMCKGRLASSYAEKGAAIHYMTLKKYGPNGACLDGAHTIIFRRPVAPLGIWVDESHLDEYWFWHGFGGTVIHAHWMGPQGAFEW